MPIIATDRIFCIHEQCFITISNNSSDKWKGTPERGNAKSFRVIRQVILWGIGLNNNDRGEMIDSKRYPCRFQADGRNRAQHVYRR